MSKIKNKLLNKNNKYLSKMKSYNDKIISQKFFKKILKNNNNNNLEGFYKNLLKKKDKRK